MVKPALAATRAVRVLDFLALHPGQAFSLKELSKACDVNAASLLAVVTALADGGYLLRHQSHKTYTIGPGVVALAHAALVQHPTIEAARRELPVLAADVNVRCAATVLMADTMVAVATAGSIRDARAVTQTGTRVPFVPPLGAVFAAYGGPNVQALWMRGEHSQEKKRRVSLERALEDVRRRGFAVVMGNPARADLARELFLLSEEPGNQAARDRVGALLDELADALLTLDSRKRKRTPVMSISVPVYSPVGDVVMSLTASGFPGPLSVEQISDIGTRMKATADSIALAAFGSLGRSDSRGRAG